MKKFNSKKISVLILVLTIAFTSYAHADEDGAFLDPRYPGPKGLRVRSVTPAHKQDKTEIQTLFSDREFSNRNARTVPARSDVWAMIAKQTPVRSQGSRGTCSIFSATALLESMLIIEEDFPQSLNLSEEWLEYIVTRKDGTEGSTSKVNLREFKNYGSATEAAMPYLGEKWPELNYSALSTKRCEKAEPAFLNHCLLGHRDFRLLNSTDLELTADGSELNDPEFATARREAFLLRDESLIRFSPSNDLEDSDAVKMVLQRGRPVVMDIDFYYGAWNHSRAGDEIGRDENAWSAGLVGYPERGSVDYKKSDESPAGHSVVIVGYDDERVLETTVKMQDGTTKSFTYKGVYYFKNSWGTGSFGTTNEINGKNFPGYGIITQRYAEEYGTFQEMKFAR